MKKLSPRVYRALESLEQAPTNSMTERFWRLGCGVQTLKAFTGKLVKEGRISIASTGDICLTQKGKDALEFHRKHYCTQPHYGPEIAVTPERYIALLRGKDIEILMTPIRELRDRFERKSDFSVSDALERLLLAMCDAADREPLSHHRELTADKMVSIARAFGEIEPEALQC